MTTIPTNDYEGTNANERFIVPDLTSVIIAGAGGDDYVEATDLDDLVSGGLGNDIIVARQGDDTVYGDSLASEDGGDDQIAGGSGNDAVFGGVGDDYVNAQDGNDFVSGDAGDDYLVGGLGADTMAGGDGNDFLFANGVPAAGPFPLLDIITVNVDGLTGLPIPPEEHGANMGQLPTIDDNASDILFGGDGEDVAYGFGGDDTLYGGSGRDFLAGGLGVDFLYGGRGKNEFVFAEFGQKNTDWITDFHEGDLIDLSADVFTRLGDAGAALKSKYFHIGKGPQTKDDRIIYNEDKAKLLYDRDGSGSDFAPKKFAVVEPGTHLDAHDFGLI